MLVRSVLVLALFGLVTSPDSSRLAAADTATPPAVVMRVPSIDGLISDLKYLAGLAGRETDAKRLDDQIKKALPKGFVGIDTKRPIGAYLILDAEGNLGDITGALLVPIADEKGFLGFLEGINAKLKLRKGEDGVYGTTSEEMGEVPVYLRFAQGYAYVTIKDKAVLAPKKLLAPDKVLAIRRTEAAAASLRIDQIPAPLKQAALSIIEARLVAVDEQKPSGETAAQHAFKVQAAKEVARQLAALLKEGGEVALHLDLDRQAQALALEASITGKPGSPLATSIAALGQGQSPFAGLVSKDSAMGGLIHLALPQNVRQALGPVVDEAIRTGLQKESDKVKRTRAEKVFKALAPSLKSGELDAALDLRRSSGSQHYTFVAGLSVKDGAAIDLAIRDIVKDLPEAERARITLDADKLDASGIHRIEIEKDLDPETRRNLGSNPFYFAVRTDAVLVSGGQDGLNALKDALKASSGPVAPVRFDLSLARLAPVMGKNKKIEPDVAVKKAFGEAGKNNDRIHVTVEGGLALKLRLDVNAPVIKFFSLIDQGAPGKN
jgi:hypothetical protein